MTLRYQTLKQMIEKRASQLEMDISTYLKYLAIKDIEENGIKQVESVYCSKPQYGILQSILNKIKTLKAR